jgi:CBS domain containing-hemolysin-like protein
VPDTKRADELLKEMKKSKTHIAVLVDEYGSTAGLVTIEDLVEEIVGDIKDEYDLNEEAEYVKVSDNIYIIDGAMNLDDLNELLDVELPTDDADTFGGYIINLLGSVPQVGQIIDTDELIMRVESVANRRVRKVHVTRVQPPPEDDESEEERSERGGASAPSAEPRIASFRLFT